MGCEFTEEPCCLMCRKALDCLKKWYYLVRGVTDLSFQDNYGNQQGPFDSFSVLYYIHFSYFEEDSVFFAHDNATNGPSSYSTLLNYVEKIVEDVRAHSPSLFGCPHFLEQFPFREVDGSRVSLAQVAADSENAGAASEESVKGAQVYECFVTEEPSLESQKRKGGRRENEDPSKVANKTILKRRLEDNLKEAELHLKRINSRRVSHLLEKSLSREHEV